MKILVVGQNFAPEVTGNAATVTGRLRYLAGRGHEVTILTGFPHYPEWRVREGYRGRLAMRERIDGVDVRRRFHLVPSQNHAAARMVYEASFLVAGVTALALPRPDVVLGVAPSLSGGVDAWLASRRFGVPFGLFVQDLSGKAAVQSGIRGGARVAGLASAIEGFVARRAEGVAVIAEGFRAPLQEAGVEAGRIHLVTDWTPVTAPSLPRAEVRARLGLPPEGVVALHSGNIGNKQGLETLVHAARIACERGLGYEVVLVGDGNQRAALEGLVASLRLPNVRFLPLQPTEIYPSMLASADVLLLHQRPAVREMSLPSKVPQYLASGTPVVAAVSEGSEAERLLRGRDIATLVPPDDPAALLDAIDGVVRDPGGAAARAARARAFAEATYTEAALGAALEGFLDRLVARSAGGAAGGAGRDR